MMPMHKACYLILILILCSCVDNDPADDTDDPPVDEDPPYEQYGSPISDLPNTEDVVMYEINLRAFSQEGNLQGIINRLDYLDSLNVNVIWLMPIHPIGEVNSVNSPYSVKDYKEVAVEYGSLADLRQLTDECHARNIAVIMDWVANHTAWDHPWINAHKDWYSQNASGEIIHPPGTNWLDVADLNYENREMRLAMTDAMKYWILEANIDGFRCDYADGVPFDFWKEAIDTLEAIPGRKYVLLAEGERLNHYSAGFDLTYAWNFYSTLKGVYSGQPATNLYDTHVSEYSGVPSGKHKLRFTTNHDESAWDQTPVVLFNGKEGALSASVISLFMGGVPLIYTGQETGRIENVPFFSNSPIDWSQNPDMRREYETLFQYYNSSQTARSGEITDYSNSNFACFTINSGTEELLITSNVRKDPSVFFLPQSLQNTHWTDAMTGEEAELTITLPFDKYQYRILIR